MKDLSRGALLVLTAVAIGTLQADIDWKALNAQARAEAKVPVHAGVPGKIPFWNGSSKAFIHPPAFDVPVVPGCAAYDFTLTDDAGTVRGRWTAAHPWKPVPGDVWDALPPAYYTLKVGTAKDCLFTRRFYRAAVFKGPYPPAARPYREAARRVYAAVFAMPHVQGWLTHNEPPEGYDLYCYPAKTLSAMIRALCRQASAEPKDAARAKAIACRMADWLIAQSQPANAAFAHFPPTYWGTRRDVSVKNAGLCMLLYPAHAANAFFDLADATGEEKYRAAACAIARTYSRIQGADGTWPLKAREKDGTPTRENRLLPGRYFLRMFNLAFIATDDAAFTNARDRAFAFIQSGPLRTWNWDGQFEDMDPMPAYQNLQKGVAVDTLHHLYALAGAGSDYLTREIVDWCEDQFTVWSDPIHHMDWKNWKTPTALEQYDYYTPIDASMADMISAFAATYAERGDILAREKAKALADNLTRHQRPDGTIPTYFDSCKGSDWVNCMVYAADRLEYLAEVLETPPRRR